MKLCLFVLQGFFLCLVEKKKARGRALKQPLNVTIIQELLIVEKKKARGRALKHQMDGIFHYKKIGSRKEESPR